MQFLSSLMLSWMSIGNNLPKRHIRCYSTKMFRIIKAWNFLFRRKGSCELLLSVFPQKPKALGGCAYLASNILTILFLYGLLDLL